MYFYRHSNVIRTHAPTRTDPLIPCSPLALSDMKNTIMNWGGPSGLRTKIVEGSFSGVPETLSTPSQTQEEIVTHLFVAKLNAATETVPSCLTACSDTTATATIEATSCFIDGVCYAEGDTAEAFGKACHVCDPATSQTEWSAGPTMGTSHCFIDGICWGDGDYLFTQRNTRAAKVYSSCQYCSPADDATAWSVAAGFEVVDDACSRFTDEVRRALYACVALGSI